ncbi:MAG: DUF120 domain-containing protein [Erysipelotrichia bacterium]|nr:DUF120 domain-containing protein [Erysipelotrichia bacterium]
MSELGIIRHILPEILVTADIYGNKVLIARSFSCLAFSDNLLEIISPVNLRSHLGISDGDTIKLALHMVSVADKLTD